MFFSRNSKDGCDCSLKVVMDVPGLQSRPCNYQLWQSPYCRRGRCVCRRQGELFVIVASLINRPSWMFGGGKTTWLCSDSQRPKINLLECIYMRVELHNANATYVTCSSFMWQLSICVLELWFKSCDLGCWLTYSSALLHILPQCPLTYFQLLAQSCNPRKPRTVLILCTCSRYTTAEQFIEMRFQTVTRLLPVSVLQSTCEDHDTAECKQRVNSTTFCSQ